MPYVFVEELSDGQTEADVVERDEYVQLQASLEEIRNQRDTAIERAVEAERGWSEAKEKYANTFLTTPSKIIDNSQMTAYKPATIGSLFSDEGR